VSAPTGRVFLIGAGPGDPGLITVRGLRLLGEADVVVYDRSAAAALRWARPDAERLEVGAPAESAVAQDAISLLLLEKARDGHTVARLKWGDPFVFDSGAKEALVLREQGIPIEVVPGVTAAFGATAYAGVPVSYPGGDDVVVLLRGREGATDAMPDVDWNALVALDGTLVCYADARLAAQVLGALVSHGAAPETRAALVHRGTLPSQHTVTGTIGDLLEHVSADAPSDIAILVVGKVASLRDHLRWFDERPLFGRRIVVTRSPEQAQELVERLENLGAQAIEAPTFRLGPPEDSEAVDRAAATIDDFDWVVFESASSVARFFAALHRGPRDIRALGATSVCAIGPSTADRLAAHGIKADVVLPEFRAESVGDALASKGSLAAARLLVVRPDHLRDLVAIDLARRGATVTDLIAYRTAADPPESPAAQALYRQLLDGDIDAVTFTGPTAVRRFTTLIGEEEAVDLLNTTVVATIGPVTAAAAAELGITSTITADTFDVDGLVEALVRHFAKASTGGHA
jgi:uroporphyrinogen III methyltransferase/synthase